MAFKWRTHQLYRAVQDHTTQPEGQFIAGLLDVHPVTASKWRTGKRAIGVRVWMVLKMAEIAIAHDPKAVVEAMEVSLDKGRRRWYSKAYKTLIRTTAAILVLATALPAQIVVSEGDTLHISVVTKSDTVLVTDTMVVTDTLTIVDTVFVGDTTPPLPGGRLILSEAGGVIIARWTDGNGQGQQFRISNSSGGTPFSGPYWGCANLVDGVVIGPSSCNRLVVGGPTPIGNLDAKIESCLVEMRTEQRGIYYSPQVDACVRLGDIVDRTEVNRIHAEYWDLTGDPFPNTVGDLSVTEGE